MTEVAENSWSLKLQLAIDFSKTLANETVEQKIVILYCKQGANAPKRTQVTLSLLLGHQQRLRLIYLGGNTPYAIDHCNLSLEAAIIRKLTLLSCPTLKTQTIPKPFWILKKRTREPWDFLRGIEDRLKLAIYKPIEWTQQYSKTELIWLWGYQSSQSRQSGSFHHINSTDGPAMNCKYISQNNQQSVRKNVWDWWTLSQRLCRKPLHWYPAFEFSVRLDAPLGTDLLKNIEFASNFNWHFHWNGIIG